jgi:hypothetical protein
MCELLTPASPVGTGIIKGNALHHGRAKFVAVLSGRVRCCKCAITTGLLLPPEEPLSRAASHGVLDVLMAEIAAGPPSGLAGGRRRASMVRHGNSDRRSLRRSDHRDHRDRRHRYSGSDPMVRPSIRAVAAAAVESPRRKGSGAAVVKVAGWGCSRPPPQLAPRCCRHASICTALAA